MVLSNSYGLVAFFFVYLNRPSVQMCAFSQISNLEEPDVEYYECY